MAAAAAAARPCQAGPVAELSGQLLSISSACRCRWAGGARAARTCLAAGCAAAGGRLCAWCCPRRLAAGASPASRGVGSPAALSWQPAPRRGPPQPCLQETLDNLRLAMRETRIMCAVMLDTKVGAWGGARDSRAQCTTVRVRGRVCAMKRRVAADRQRAGAAGMLASPHRSPAARQHMHSCVGL